MALPSLEVRIANPRADRVRRVHRLARRAGRERTGQFAVEGPQAVREALVAHAATGDVVCALYATPAAAQRYADEVEVARSAGLEPVGVADDVMAAMTDTVSPQGLLAVCAAVARPLADVLAPVPSLVAVMAHVRDPGNAGAVLRVADAAGAGAVVLTEASVDVHNPKCVRSTAGSLFHLAVAQGATLCETVDRLREKGFAVLAADGGGEVDLDELQDDAERGPEALLRRPTAWVFGNEAWGMPPEHQALVDAVVRVPIRGRAESLNLATAAAVCLYASARAQQRGRHDVSPTR